MQFVMGLPDLPKTEAKRAILVTGPLYETLSFPDLPFILNRTIGFPSVFKCWDLYVAFICRCTSILRIFIINTFSCREKPERQISKLGGNALDAGRCTSRGEG